MAPEPQKSREPNMRTLITGFGPFGTFDANPSSWLAEHCGRPFRVLEVSYAAVDHFLEELAADSFGLLVMLGVAGTSQRMRFETVARNWVGTTPDVRGVIHGPEPIDRDAPSQLSFSPARTIPTNELWETSFDAGDYLCNYISFRAKQRFPTKRVFFIHVPPFEFAPPDVQLAQLLRMVDLLERS